MSGCARSSRGPGPCDVRQFPGAMHALSAPKVQRISSILLAKIVGDASEDASPRLWASIRASSSSLTGITSDYAIQKLRVATPSVRTTDFMLRSPHEYYGRAFYMAICDHLNRAVQGTECRRPTGIHVRLLLLFERRLHAGRQRLRCMARILALMVLVLQFDVKRINAYAMLAERRRTAKRDNA